MNFGYATIIPYKVRKQYSPVFASTSADSSTFCAATLGDNYALTIQCVSGSIAYSVIGVPASASVGNQIIARDSHTILVTKTEVNPQAILSIIGLSTTSAYQAWVMG